MWCKEWSKSVLKVVSDGIQKKNLVQSLTQKWLSVVSDAIKPAHLVQCVPTFRSRLLLCWDQPWRNTEEFIWFLDQSCQTTHLFLPVIFMHVCPLSTKNCECQLLLQPQVSLAVVLLSLMQLVRSRCINPTYAHLAVAHLLPEYPARCTWCTTASKSPGPLVS